MLGEDVAARAGADGDARASATATKASEHSLRVVQRAWRRVLGRRGLDTDTPFEEAGGDSLKLLTLHFELEREEKRELPLERFQGYQRPTDLAAVLDELLSDEDSPADTRPIISLIPGLGGDEPRLAHFRVGCGHALRFHVIKLPGWRALAQPAFGWEALVAGVADQIPSGPVLLAGYSFGAHVAVATADLLRRQGRDVGYIAPLDEAIPGVAVQPPPKLRNAIGHVIVGFQRGRPIESLAEAIAPHLAKPGARRMLQLGAAAWWLRLPPRLGFPLDHYLCKVMQDAVAHEWRDRQPCPSVVATLFRSEQRSADPRYDLGWRSLLPDLTVIPVSGSHQTMFEDANLAPLCRLFIDVVKAVIGANLKRGHEGASS
jgi:thioesterase domain-containing protein/acyl carrier protein